jgi:hypothetical protein
MTKSVASTGLLMQRGCLSRLPRHAGATQYQAASETELTPARIRPMHYLLCAA